MKTKDIDAELALKNKQTPYKIVCPKHSLSPLRFDNLPSAMEELNHIKNMGIQAILTFNKGTPVTVKCCYRKSKERRI